MTCPSISYIGQFLAKSVFQPPSVRQCRGLGGLLGKREDHPNPSRTVADKPVSAARSTAMS